jgi:hypothetical protein
VGKDPPPLLGFNNNVRHRGRIFHIQTEDSGIKYPRIVTHLFADGGRIVKTARTDYAEHVGQKDMSPIVRRMMKEQHKAMFIALRAGTLDELLEKVCGPLKANDGAAEPHPSGETLAAAAPPPGQGGDRAVERAAWSASATPSSGSPAASAPAADGAKELHEVRVVPGTAEVFERDSRSLNELSRAAEQALAPAASSEHGAAPVPQRPARSATSESGRYAASRPAAIFGQLPSPEQQSIFGDSVISEKSLDEVILSYLAEDLEGTTQK